MPPALKSLGAIAAAIAMVVGAVFVRNALDTKKVRDDLRLTVACDPLAQDFCRAAAEADPRITIRVERPDATTRKLVELPQGGQPDFQAWVTVGPWLQMAEGRRSGQAPLQKAVMPVASSAVVLLTRPEGFPCAKAPAACLPLQGRRVGLPSPDSNGIGLAGLAQVVLADTGIPTADLDRTAIEQGPAALVIDRLARSVNLSAGLEQINASFSQANPLVLTQAAAPDAPGRAKVVTSTPPVRAVLQVGILDVRATEPLGSEPAGRALAKAATDARWDSAGDPSGGLPEPGVLAALQDAWSDP